MNTKTSPWKKNLDLLPPRQIIAYENSLEVLRQMRRGATITTATKNVGTTIPTVKKYAGSALQKKRRRINVKENDTLLRKMRIYEDGKEVWIQVRGNKQAKIIGKYHSAVGRLTDHGQKDAMGSFKDTTVTDAKGRRYSLETNTSKIKEIREKIEEPEYFIVYSSGGAN